MNTQWIIEGLIGDGLSCDDQSEYQDGEYNYKLAVFQDEDASINDYESDGRISHYIRHSDRHEGRGTFTGRARKIDVDRSGFVWWEPYDGEYGWQEPDGEGGVEWHHGTWEQLPTAEQKRQQQRITDLIQHGFYMLVLEGQERCSMGHWHTTRTTSLSGIDSLDTANLTDIVSEMLGEIANPS